MVTLRLLSLALLVGTATAAQQRHIQVIGWLYGNFSNGYDIAVNRNIPAGIFDESVGGTILPLGTYDSLDETIDYFYGQSAPFGPQPNAPPTNYTIREYVEDGNVVSATVDVDIRFPGNNLGDPRGQQYFTFNGMYEFTNTTKSATIKRYNVVIPRGSEYYRALYPVSWANVLSPTLPYQDFIKTSICRRHDLYCLKTDANGNQPDKQYNSQSECVAFLNTLQFGIGELGNENTVMCRWIHSANAAARAVHCPHIGVSGGPFCRSPRKYEDFYHQEQTRPMYAVSNNGQNDE